LRTRKIRLIELHIDGMISKEQFLEKMREYEEKENKIIQKIAEIKTRLNQIAIKP